MANAMLSTSLTRSTTSSAAQVSIVTPPYSRSVSSTYSKDSRSLPPASLDVGYGSLRKGTSTSSTGTSPAEAKRQLRAVQQEVDQVKAYVKPRATNDYFRKACSTDLLFLIDTTSSMENYIDATRRQVKSIISDIRGTFFNEPEVRVAVVGYKDHNNKYDKINIQFLNFTTSIQDVHNFLDGVEAYCGGDCPEDVLGGVNQALRAQWMQQTRCIIHIGDGPAHSHELNDYSKNEDDFYEPGSEPHRLRYRPLIQQLINLKINYGFLRISSSTDKTAFAFSQVYAQAGAHVKLLKTNSYQDYGSIQKSNSVMEAQPLFEELHLGTKPEDIRRLALKMVTTSVSGTASRFVVGSQDRESTRPTQTRISSNLSMLQEAQNSVNDLRLDKSLPHWNSAGWLDKILEVKGECPDVVHDASTLNNMFASDDNIKLGFIEFTMHARSMPFDNGSVRTATYARTSKSNSRFVLKSYIKEGQHVAHFHEDMRIQAFAKSFALEFNSMLKLEMPIDFVVTACIRSKDKTPSRKENLSLEPFLDGGPYVKYNGNNGYVCEDTDNPFFDTAQAFTHFTFERSWGQFMISDLQGVRNLLTDPAIQTRDPERFKLSDTNLGVSGFKLWFSSHPKCNAICRKLGLKSRGDMLITEKFEFRKSWPTMDPTICCASKLCRKIIRAAEARSLDQVRGYEWCYECYTQIHTTMTWRTCAEPGVKHDFEVSDFFHETQGQLPPVMCPEHREKDTSKASATSIGASLYKASKTTAGKGAIDIINW
jgi:hypothetical protein